MHRDQRNFDNASNENGGEKTKQLENTMNLAKSLLCAIETAFNNTNNIPIKYVTRHEMNKIIGKSKSITLHVREMFAVTRFSDFVNNIYKLMEPKAQQLASGEKKNLSQNKKVRKVGGNKKNLRKRPVKKIARG